MITRRIWTHPFLKWTLQIVLWSAFAILVFGYALGGFIAMWLIDSGRPREGIAVYRLALRIYPWNAANRNDLGLTLLEYGDVHGAIDELRKAVALSPHVAKLHDHLGFALFKGGNFDEAILEFQEAVRLAPWHEPYRNDLQMALTANGEGVRGSGRKDASNPAGRLN